MIYAFGPTYLNKEYIVACTSSDLDSNFLNSVCFGPVGANVQFKKEAKRSKKIKQSKKLFAHLFYLKILSKENLSHLRSSLLTETNCPASRTCFRKNCLDNYSSEIDADYLFPIKNSTFSNEQFKRFIDQEKYTDYHSQTFRFSFQTNLTDSSREVRRKSWCYILEDSKQLSDLENKQDGNLYYLNLATPKKHSPPSVNPKSMPSSDTVHVFDFETIRKNRNTRSSLPAGNSKLDRSQRVCADNFVMDLLLGK